MVIERFAKSSAKVAGTGIGASIGSALSSPFGLGVLGLGAVAVTLFIFKDRISEFFQNALKIPPIDITLPTINIPNPFEGFEFPTFELPTFELPTFELPEFNLCTLFGIGCPEEPAEPDPPTTPIIEEVTEQCNENCNIVQDAAGVVTIQCVCDGEVFSGVGVPPPPEIPPPPPELPPPPPIIIDPELDVEGEFEGGGPSFIGGGIGQTPITTLFQVLDLFPLLSASGAANFLFQFSGISPSDALNLEQFMQFQ